MSKDEKSTRVRLNDSMTVRHLTTAHLNRAVTGGSQSSPQGQQQSSNEPAAKPAANSDSSEK